MRKRQEDEEETGVSGEPAPKPPARPNEVTRIYRIEPEQKATFEATFRAIFAKLKPIHDAFREDGVLIVAARPKGPIEAYLHLPVRDEGGAFAVIGRHDRCGLVLREEGISLRHALVRATATARGELRLRLIDLQSGTAFRTEDDLACKTVVAEGPLFVSAAGYQLFFLPPGALGPGTFAADPKQTWLSFPERVYLDRRVPERMVSGAYPVLHSGAAKFSRRSTVTTILPGAESLRARPSAGGLALATIRLAAGGAQLAHRVSTDDLDRGVLIGRYERCQLAGDDRSLSRVHLVLLRDEDGGWAVDTASRNGTHVGGRSVVAVALDREVELHLANTMTLRWVPERHAQA